MSVQMEVFCGTKNAEAFEIDLDRYDRMISTEATDEEMSKAFQLLCDTMTDMNFADDGHRNNSAVNACIALHVMGYDACSWLENFCAEQRMCHNRWFESDLDKFMEHVDRITPYLSGWGPQGEEGRALDYALY